MRLLTIILIFITSVSFAQDDVIVKYAKDYSQKGVLDTLLFPEIKTIKKLTDDFVKRWYTIKLKDGYDIEEFITKCDTLSMFEYVAKNKIEATEFMIPNDTMYSYQANLMDNAPIKNANYYTSSYYPDYFIAGGYPPVDSNEIIGQGIDIEDAWNITTGDSSVWLGFIESGVNWTGTDGVYHPDLRKAKYNWSYEYNKDTIQLHYHGTPIVGTACAITNNTTGIAGIAGGWGDKPGCGYVTLDALAGFATDYLVLAMEKFTELGVPVVNMSFGIPYNMNDVRVIVFEEAMKKYMSTPVGELTNGGVIVAAVGNYHVEFDSIPDTYPTSPIATLPGILSMRYDGLIGVGNCGIDDTLSPYSVRGNILTVVAPSRYIASLATPGDGYSTNEYVLIRDIATSGAAPQVVGVIGLILSEYPNYFTNKDIKEIIEDSADDIEAMQVDSVKGKVGAGRINAYKALLEAKDKIQKRMAIF